MACAEGVGLGYHPFHHAALLARAHAFDFIELPLDLYLDAARAALLDPMDARLREITAGKPCVWRGSALSLGSVERAGEPTPDPRVVERIQLLMQRTGAGSYCDRIGFRCLDGADLGVPQSLPCTEVAAKWVAARAVAAGEALGPRLLLQPVFPVAAAAGADMAAFPRRVVALAGCELLLDVDDLRRSAAETEVDPAALAGRLPEARVAVLATSGEDEADWTLLSLLAGRTAARAIVIRRTRDLFPLDAIERAADRASKILAHVARPDPQPPVSEDITVSEAMTDHDLTELAALRSWQAEFIAFCLSPGSAAPRGLADVTPARRTRLATQLQTWQVWRDRIGDTHKARQIARFLSEEPGNRTRRGG